LKIIKSFFLGLILSGAVVCAAFAQDNASYKVEHYSMSIGRDGVTRQTSYSETLYRNGSQVIYVRNLPANISKRDKHDRHDERHFDSTLTPQLITLKKNGEVDFTYLDLDNKIRIEVPKVEFNTVGFSGSWVNSFSLVDPMIFKKMIKKEPGSKPNTVWYEQVTDRGLTRILWDEKNKIASVVEVSNKDGSMKNRSSSELISLNSNNPLFTQANTFTSKVISDYRD